jgi:hypothetical protein
MSDGTDLNNGMGGNGDSIITDGGAQQGGSTEPLRPYMAQLPDNLKQNKLIAESETFGDLASRFIELHGKADGAVKIPGEGASDEEVKAYLSAVGVPDTADGYQINADNLPEGLQVTEEAMKYLKEASHELALNPKQAQGVFDKWNAEQARREQAGVEARKKSAEDGIAALRTKWAGDYDSKLAAAKKAVNDFGEIAGVNIQEELAALGNLDNNPAMLRIFAAIGERISEDSRLPGAGGREAGQQTDGLGRPLLTPDAWAKK